MVCPSVQLLEKKIGGRIALPEGTRRHGAMKLRYQCRRTLTRTYVSRPMPSAKAEGSVHSSIQVSHCDTSHMTTQSPVFPTGECSSVLRVHMHVQWHNPLQPSSQERVLVKETRAKKDEPMVICHLSTVKLFRP